MGSGVKDEILGHFASDIFLFLSPIPYLRSKNIFFKSMACGYSKLEALDADYNAKIRFQFR